LTQTKLYQIFAQKGFTDAHDYVRVHTLPGMGTVDRYLRGDQDPLTRRGNWRKAALTITSNLGVEVEVAFPEDAERREQYLDDLSIETYGGLKRQGILNIMTYVRCPKSTSNVSIDTSCRKCEYFDKVDGTDLHCNFRPETST